MRPQQIGTGRMRWLGLLRLIGWRGVLGLAAVAALIIAVTVAAAGIFLLLLPVIALTGLLARGLLRRPQRPPLPADANLIEGRFERLDAGWRPGQPARPRQ